MTLAHPALNSYSKKKTKHKFRNADEARRAREADAMQKKIYANWGISDNKTTPSKKDYIPVYSHRSSDTKISSITGNNGICAKKDSKKYSGDLVVGIAVMHKSCLQPIISQEQATESAHMRR